MRLSAIISITLFVLTAIPAAATEAGWALLRNGGQVVLLVHANAPGTGEPANFEIGNCRTQRNLSERGRQQARKIGALIAARSEPVEQIYSSRYCRALDTVQLAFGTGEIIELAALDPLGTDPEADEAAHDEVLKLIREYSGSGNLLLVTHRENVTAWTGIKPREAEAIIVVPDGVTLRSTGRIVFN